MEIAPGQHVVVTGAGGYIGECLIRSLERAGASWTGLSREEPRSGPNRTLPFALGQPLDPRILELPRVDGIVHLAAETGAREVNSDAELRTAEALLEVAERFGARFVFSSSQAAAPDAPTEYGRTKWRIEQLVARSGGTVVRIGQVYGGPARGLFGALSHAARRLPALPRFVPEPTVQPIHVYDVAEALTRITLAPEPLAPHYVLASPEPVAFSRFMQVLARRRHGRRLLRVPFPRVILSAVRRILNALGWRVPAAIDRLESLFRLPLLHLPPGQLASLGIALRPLEDGMAKSGHGWTRDLVAEIRAVLRHIAGREPPGVLVRRCAREFVAAGDPSRAARLRWATGRTMTSLARGAPGSDPGAAAADLLAVVRALEASPFGAQQMLPFEPASLPAAIVRIAAALLSDVVLRVRTSERSLSVRASRSDGR